MPGAPTVVAGPQGITGNIIDHRPAAPAPVTVAAGVGPQQLAGAWPIGLELVAPAHVFVNQGHLADHRQFRQLGQVDHSQENIGLELYRFRLLFVAIVFAVLGFLRLRRGIGGLKCLCLQQIKFVAIHRGPGEVGGLRQHHAAQRGVGVILRSHPDGRPALLAKVPVGALGQLQQIVARRDDLIDCPRQLDLAFHDRVVAVGRIHRKQFLAGDRQDEILILGGAARLQRVLDDAALLQRLFVQVDDLDVLDVAAGLVALVRHEDQPGMRQHSEGLLVILRLAPRPAVAHGDLVEQLRLGDVAHVEQRHGDTAAVVRVVHADRDQAVAQRLDVSGPARHLELALDLRLARVGQVNNPQRIDPLVSHDVHPVGVEARGKQALALGQAQLAKRPWLARVGQAERLKRGLPAIAIITGVAVELLRDDRERVAAQAHFELVRHTPGGADGGHLFHRAVRRGDVDAAQVGLVIILRNRGGDEKELVGGINIVVVAAVEKSFARDRLGRVFQVERRHLRAVLPSRVRVAGRGVDGFHRDVRL